MGKFVYVGFSVGRGFVAASTKVGLGKLVGVSVATVRRNLGGMVGGGDRSWWVGKVEVVRLARGRFGKGGGVGLLSSKLKVLEGEKWVPGEKGEKR